MLINITIVMKFNRGIKYEKVKKAKRSEKEIKEGKKPKYQSILHRLTPDSNCSQSFWVQHWNICPFFAFTPSVSHKCTQYTNRCFLRDTVKLDFMKNCSFYTQFLHEQIFIAGSLNAQYTLSVNQYVISISFPIIWRR